MRKLSVAPLLILIAMFLWTRFASAATSLPTTLPAKKKVATKPAKKAPSKRTIYVIDASPSLAKTLPAKRKTIVNFDQPALPMAPPVVVREDAAALAAEIAAEVVQRRDVTEAPVLEFVGPELQQSAIEIPNTAARTLRPALPDSDSFEMAGGARATPPAVVAQVQSQAQAQSQVLAQPQPVIVTAPALAPEPVAAATATATASSSAAVTETPAEVASTIFEEEPSDSVVQETTSAQTATAEATVSATTTAPGLAGPPAPPVFDTSIIETTHSTKSTNITAAEKAIDADKGNPGDRPVELKASTVFLVPSNETPRRRLFIRGGYLNAEYSKLESDLKNGATLFGVSASQVFSKTEVRLGLDFAYGLDQQIALRNTRMAMFRAEGLYNLASFAETASFYIGGALGLADIQVTSYRSKSANGDVTVRENAKGTAFLGAPEVGSRINIGRQVSFDLSVQYLLLMGGDQVSSLGGLLAEGALGFRF